ncbi:MAG TPA: DUF222 domain-containing protein, partial [Actinomycetota bacterium]
MDPLLTDTQDLIGRVQTLHREIAERQRELLEVLAQLETRRAWVEDGAHDMAQWTSMALDVSRWKADRLLGAGRALPTLPATAHALARGDLGIDKVVELARFATPETESRLIPWARAVSCGTVRHRGDIETKPSID